MTLQELFDLCGASAAGDWNKIIFGPSYLGQFIENYPHGGAFELRYQEHLSRASFKPDLAIGIAWGMDADPALDGEKRVFNEEWATQFPDQAATKHLVDFFYNGALVGREHYVRVDGRCSLPIPRMELEGQGPEAEVTALTITAWQADFFRVLNALETAVEYDRYLDEAGFELRD